MKPNDKQLILVRNELEKGKKKKNENLPLNTECLAIITKAYRNDLQRCYYIEFSIYVHENFTEKPIKKKAKYLDKVPYQMHLLDKFAETIGDVNYIEDFVDKKVVVTITKRGSFRNVDIIDTWYLESDEEEKRELFMQIPKDALEGMNFDE